MMRTAGIVALVVLLAVNTAAANAAVAADRTVLDPGFVQAGLEEERAYERLTEVAVEAVGAEAAIEAPGVAAIEIDQAAIVEEALPPAYLEARAEANIDRTYAYLHGERDDLVLTFDPAPVEDRAASAVATQIEATPSSSIIRGIVGDETLRVDGVEVDLVILARMAADRSAYREARRTVRADIRSAVLDGLVEDAYRTADADQLLSLVVTDYDPDAYTESEKEAMIADREAEIRAALRERFRTERGDEVEAAVGDRLELVREEARVRVEEAVAANAGGADGAAVDAATAMVLASVDGLTTDLAYGAYEERLGDAKTRLASSAGAAAGDRVASQLPSSVDVTAELSPAEERRLRTVRTGVQAAGGVAIGLSLLGLALIGGVWWVTRSTIVTAGGAGGGLIVGALPGIVIAGRLPAMARAAVSGRELAGFGDVLVGLVAGAAGVLATQSFAILGIGVAAGAVGLGLYLDDRGRISLPVG